MNCSPRPWRILTIADAHRLAVSFAEQTSKCV